MYNIERELIQSYLFPSTSFYGVSDAQMTI